MARSRDCHQRGAGACLVLTTLSKCTVCEMRRGTKRLFEIQPVLIRVSGGGGAPWSTGPLNCDAVQRGAQHVIVCANACSGRSTCCTSTCTCKASSRAKAIAWAAPNLTWPGASQRSRSIRAALRRGVRAASLFSLHGAVRGVRAPRAGALITGVGAPRWGGHSAANFGSDFSMIARASPRQHALVTA